MPRAPAPYAPRRAALGVAVGIDLPRPLGLLLRAGPLALRGSLPPLGLLTRRLGPGRGLLGRLALLVGHGAVLLGGLELAFGARLMALGLRRPAARLHTCLGHLPFPVGGPLAHQQQGERDEHDDDDHDDDDGHAAALPPSFGAYPPGYAPPMPPLDMDTALGWRGRTVRDQDGEEIGTLGDLYLDGESDLPAWGSVRTGLFGRNESLFPLDRAEETEEGDLRVPFARQDVVDAPNVDPDVALEPEQEEALRRHYAGDEGEAAQERGGAVAAGREPPEHAEPGGAADEDTRDAGGGDADDRGDEAEGVTRERGEGGPEMIRSEEELKTGTTPMKPRERVRIRKVLVTDHVKRTVPVRREEVRLETDPPETGRVESADDVPE
jgi:hypothetical protein